MPRMSKSEAKKQAAYLLEEVLRLVDKFEYIKRPVGEVLFWRLAEAYASANFAYGEFEGGGRSMLNLDEADIVYTLLQRLARNLGQKYEKMADTDMLEERFNDIAAGEKAEDRAERMYLNHHDCIGKSIAIARVMEMHSTHKPSKLWWGRVRRILEAKKAKYEPQPKAKK